MTEALDLYISYAEKDETWLDQLEEQLAQLRRRGKIRPWDKSKIEAGENRQRQIEERLEAADLILLLLSPAFLASDFCYDVVADRALRRQASGEALVVPVIIRPCDWQNSPFVDLDPLPRNGDAISLWQNADQAWLDVVNDLRATIQRFQRNRGGASAGGRPREEQIGRRPAFRLIEEPFEYRNSRVLDGQSGGRGFAGDWSADPARTRIVTPGLGRAEAALELIGGPNADAVIQRRLESEIGTTFYASVLLRLEAGTIDNSDFIALWFDDLSSEGGVDAPTIGLKNLSLMARVGNGGNALTSVTPMPGETYRVVAKFTHDGEFYHRADVWIDPSHGRSVEPAPDKTNVSLTSANRVVTHVGIRTHGLLNARKRLLFGGLKIGGTWSEVA